MKIEEILPEIRKGRRFRQVGFQTYITSTALISLDREYELEPENKWEVLVKYEDDNNDSSKNLKFPGGEDGSYEISVIKTDNIHGHGSWGWASSSEKIILFAADGCGSPIEPFNKKEWNRCIEIANVICEKLNK